MMHFACHVLFSTKELRSPLGQLPLLLKDLIIGRKLWKELRILTQVDSVPKKVMLILIVQYGHIDIVTERKASNQIACSWL